MTSIISSQHRSWSIGVQEHVCGVKKRERGRFNDKVPCSVDFGPCRGLIFFTAQSLAGTRSARKYRPTFFSSTVDDDGIGPDPDDSEEEDGVSEKKDASKGEPGPEGVYIHYKFCYGISCCNMYIKRPMSFSFFSFKNGLKV